MANTDPSGADVAGLRAGAALLAADQPRAARTAWARAGPAGSPLVVGLVTLGAAVESFHAGDRSASWTRARRADDALDRVGDDTPVAVAPIRTWLEGLSTTAVPGETKATPAVRIDGAPVDPEALDIDALERAATALGAAVERYEEYALDDAARYAREEVGEGGSAFGGLLTDLVAGRSEGVAYARLRQRVSRRRSEEQDVDGLFDGGGEGGSGGDAGGA